MSDFRNFEVKGIRLYKSEFPSEWLKHLGNPKVIVEFGSYDGGDGAFYKQMFPDARVISIEASPSRSAAIASYAGKLGIEFYECAISNYTGEIDFYEVYDPNVLDCPDKTGSSGSINKRTDLYKSTFSHLVEKKPVQIISMRFDDFCEAVLDTSEVDFVHIDVEGAEHKVLEGMGELRPKVMWLERYLGKEYYGPDAYSVGDIEKICESMGYSIVESTPSDILVKLL